VKTFSARHLFLLLFAFLLIPATGQPCFGPRLFIAADTSAQQQALYALVSIYLKEKTGTESTPVSSDGGLAGDLIATDKADLAICRPGGDEASVVFAVPGVPLICSGDRPRSDIQFTLVLPALKKLSGLLAADDFRELSATVAEGRPPLAAARAFLDARGWL